MTELEIANMQNCKSMPQAENRFLKQGFTKTKITAHNIKSLPVRYAKCAKGN